MKHYFCTRFFDIIFSFFGILFFMPLFFVLIFIGYFQNGSPIFKQNRMGKGKKSFIIYKLRSMKINAPSLSTHLVDYSEVTRFGGFLRKFKLDELPQLWNVLVGEMSLVGPRPNLFNQEELIAERSSRGVYSVRPGITGLAQINKIDMSTPEFLAEIDASMIQEFNIWNYFKYIFLTIFGKGFGDRIKN